MEAVKTVFFFALLFMPMLTFGEQAFKIMVGSQESPPVSHLIVSTDPDTELDARDYQITTGSFLGLQFSSNHFTGSAMHLNDYSEPADPNWLFFMPSLPVITMSGYPLYPVFHCLSFRQDGGGGRVYDIEYHNQRVMNQIITGTIEFNSHNQFVRMNIWPTNITLGVDIQPVSRPGESSRAIDVQLPQDSGTITYRTTSYIPPTLTESTFKESTTLSGIVVKEFFQRAFSKVFPGSKQ
ncbi:hypothetical protein GZ77_08545 [Endozoicomonas montiporae]|uniref:Uncharacterized protein n=2 Tax=Endozoicomonas montiporae TaxID=1027273 RepID=A0A081N7J3_9GAMM|nr:hypothetical protein [Endozoicomonas montiporae]AMO55742.1 hypothetical protein EZMO1_1584 [Endozoicomonas montiporae CL-33]KEQ14416.1 hypothetical protein GZ77_08545 [Endozoicomonas montiporae]